MQNELVASLPASHPGLFQNAQAAFYSWIAAEGGDVTDPAVIWLDDRDERMRRVWRMTPQHMSVQGLDILCMYYMQGSTTWHMSHGLYMAKRNAGALKVVKAGEALPDAARWCAAGGELVRVELNGDLYWVPRTQTHRVYERQALALAGWEHSTGEALCHLDASKYARIFELARHEAEQTWLFW